MSNFLAIATVTAALRRLLQNSVQNDVSGATATTVRPDTSGSSLPEQGVNIFLYQVTPNASWNNTDLPTRNSAGQVVQRPRAALDLHYLLTFYGEEAQFGPQRVLGSVVRTLHARPVLTPPMIQATLEALEDDHPLLPSNLAEEVERVKFTPLPLTLEELSKLWSVFFQTPYSLSLAYVGSVVLIEAEETPRRSLPVRERNIEVFPFRRAIIEKIVSEAGDNQPIEMGDTILIKGSGLGGPIRAVCVGRTELEPLTGRRASSQIAVALTDPSLRAGIQGVRVVYRDDTESNVMPIILRPVITVNEPNVTDGEIEVPITFDPAVHRTQRVVLHLNEFEPPENREPFAYSFEAPANNGITDPEIEETTEIVFPVSNVEPGEYLVRVQVDGAESVLGVEEIEIEGEEIVRYHEPVVTIPS